jgi:hypothetical protein
LSVNHCAKWILLKFADMRFGKYVVQNLDDLGISIIQRYLSFGGEATTYKFFSGDKKAEYNK